MLRFGWNSYEAVRYISADVPPDPARKAQFVLVLPAVNRQLLDLLFSLVYMLDDLIPRSLDYQKAGWRDLVEEKSALESQFGELEQWSDFLAAMNSQVDTMVDRFGVSAEEQRDIKLVNYWRTPFKLAKREGPCQKFLQFLERVIYKDISAQAHLTFAGLLKVSGFLMADLLDEQVPALNRQRALQSYHFQQVSRTAIVYLAVLSEIDSYLKMGNQNAIDYLWVLFSEYVVEAKEIYEVRYRDRKRYG